MLSVLTGANPTVARVQSTSTADASAAADSIVVGMHLAPAVSLRAFDAAVCIANDTP